MLSTMRGTVSGIFAKTLMMFLVVTFAVWGIGDVVRGGAAPNALVSVGDSTITTQEFAREMQHIQRNAGNSIPPEMLNSEAMRQQVLQRMVGMRMGEVAAHDAGFAVGDDMIANQTRLNPAFRNEKGGFNPQAFEAFLRGTQQTEAVYRQQVSKDTLYSIYTSSVDLDQLTIPDSYMSLKELVQNEKRGAKLITISAQSAADADEDALKEYYEQTKDRYMQPEKRSFTYAVISKASIDAAIKGDETGAALEDLGYAVDDAVAAGSTMQKALSDAKLAANVHTLTASAGAGKSPVEQAVVEQGFTLEEGESSGLLSAKDGTYFMVSVDEITSATPKPYASVKADVAKQYQVEKGAEASREKANELKAELNGADSIAAQVKLAQDKGASVRDTGLLAREGNKDVPDAMLRGLFDADKGDVIGPVALKNGDFAIAILSDISVPNEAPQVNAATKEQLTTGLSGSVYALWANDAVKRYEVRQIAGMPGTQAQE